ncbi:6-phosphogluconolactonase [Corynebacterium tapiri]|uniref:6-phosphogluconolactonase n=1 Tax=Corynebacterium tapiri TaxID=1448266 RepID=A0A5C4U3F5_9CORY|nr:6-phosphogluconolactonase [Corynebacterium tapiri]TNL97567.1 6-phosphogluconolactonase [Corynebacterium tapiri]
MISVHRTRDIDALTDEAADRFVSVVKRVQDSGRHARVVLTGGTPGIGTLKKLRERASEIDFTRIQFFFGDERNVAVEHSDSNEGQAREALLDHVDIPQENIHSYGLGTKDMETAARDYAETLAQFAPEGFDIHLLGMGPEGHINTLFPHTDAVAERRALVVPVYDSPKPPSERVTLTLPAVWKADHVWLLVSGEEKAEAARNVIARADSTEWPAAGAEGREETIIFLDDAAAQDIA